MNFPVSHAGVGPTGDRGTDHQILAIGTWWHRDDVATDEGLFFCIDCGLADEDVRQFAVTDCDRERNPVPKTLREAFNDADSDLIDF